MGLQRASDATDPFSSSGNAPAVLNLDVEETITAGADVTFFGTTGVLDEAQADAEIDDGWGVAGQGGLNVFVTDGFALMADFRWVSILNDPDVEAVVPAGSVEDELDLDYAIVSAGVGFRF